MTVLLTVSLSVCRKALRSLGEAIVWTGWYQIAQLISVTIFVFVLVVSAFGLHWPHVDQFALFFQEMELERSFSLIGVASLGALLFVLPTVAWRFGRGFRSRLGFQCPRHEELIFAVAMVAPISVLGTALYQATGRWWGAGSMAGPESDTMSALLSGIHAVPFPILIVALALGPAIGEEIVFRGVIGRQLVEKWGILVGSSLTVLLFAFSHGSLAHAVATIPIACLLQFLYLKTSTLWIPILVHFLNNAAAVTAARFENAFQTEASLALIIGGGLYLTAILVAYEYRRYCWSNTAKTY